VKNCLQLVVGDMEAAESSGRFVVVGQSPWIFGVEADTFFGDVLYPRGLKQPGDTVDGFFRVAHYLIHLNLSFGKEKVTVFSEQTPRHIDVSFGLLSQPEIIGRLLINRFEYMNKIAYLDDEKETSSRSLPLPAVGGHVGLDWSTLICSCYMVR